MAIYNGDLNASNIVDNPTAKDPGKGADRLFAWESLAMPARVVSSVTHEWTFTENADQVTTATGQELSKSAAGSSTEDFVAWAPTKRLVNKQFIAPDGEPQSCLHPVCLQSVPQIARPIKPRANKSVP